MRGLGDSVSVLDDMSAGPVLVIRDVTELRALRARPHRLRASIALQLPGLDADVARAAGERIEAYRRECGCSLGAMCMAAGFAVTVLALAVRGDCTFRAVLASLPWAVVSALVGAGAGKAVGLLRARVRLRHEIDRLIVSQEPALT
jgi:hypothetical protein